MTSQRKIESNRRNALKSTGPKSVLGKAIASKNGTKHGLSGLEGLLPDEDPAEHEEFRSDSLRDLKPVGFMEKQTVETIIRCSWSLRRCQRTESGLLGGGRHVMDRIMAKTSEEFVEMLRCKEDLEDLTSEQVFGRLLVLLSEDYLSKTLNPHSIAILRDNDLAGKYQQARIAEVRMEDYQAVLDKELMDLFFKLVESEQQRNPLTYDVALAFRKDLSEQETLLKLARYEAALQRSLDRGLQRLHRLQDRRQKTSTSRPDVIDVDPSGGSE